MTKKVRENGNGFASQFAEAFHEVVVPVLEPMAKDIKTLKEGIATLDDKVERINKRLYLVTDHQADRIDNHEKRIRKLEKGVSQKKES